MQWHHIVEQHGKNIFQFGANKIHNVNNIVKIPVDIHRNISGYYSSVQPFTNGQTVRQFISKLPMDAQRRFGIQVMRRFGVGM